MTIDSVTTSRTHIVHEGARISVCVAYPRVTPRVTVMLLGAIWSVTDHIEHLGTQLAEAGFGAIAPCLFRGEGIPARDAAPQVLAQAFLDFDDRRCLRDLRAVARAASDGAFGPVGKIVPCGFCLGGRFAHDLAATSEHVAGTVVFYGRMRFARQPTKPFLPIELTGLIEVPYLGHFAEFDELIPPEDVEELDTALDERGVQHAVHVYAGARHSFFDPTRSADHDAKAASLAWSRTLEFLHDLE